MTIWNQNEYLRAWNFASKHHNGQILPGSDIPYINHIGLVAMEASAAVAADGDLENPDLLVLCALLHDVIEDTPVTYEEVKGEFGVGVADGVLALTKNPLLSSKREQMADSLLRIRQQPKAVWMVKLCDRITNLQPPPGHWGREKIFGYREEAALILDQLGTASPFLASRLMLKIEEYAGFLK